MTGTIQFNYENVLSEKVGKEGIELEELKNLQKRFVQVKKNLLRKKEYLAFTHLPDNLTQAREIKKFVKKIRDTHRFDNFVVIGIGGSALGNRALQDSLNHPYWNFLSKEERKGWLRLFVLDNIDPQEFSGLVRIIDLKKTIFNVISKSGETTECLANFALFKDLLKKKVRNKWREQVIITTDEKKGYLRKIANEEKIFSYAVPENLGGRYSVLSPVGLVSAAFAGIDIEKLLLGAKEMVKICSTDELMDNPAGLYAAIQYLLYQRGKNISVMLAYSNRFYSIADWYRQLWAESLGKEVTTSTGKYSIGPTPIKALGVTDQHSQLQLYLDGPKDKVVTFLSVRDSGEEIFLPQFNQNNLSGKSLNKIFHTEEEATRRALTEKQCPNCVVLLPEINPYMIGQLFYFFELATAYAGEFFQVNPFDQPAVELIKKYTKNLLENES
ncbi:MAG TPA: glucose-6-phosphate isomerase [Elusimicrobia bacterium]|jgi:glucose-6-phosphate isomerase|nr:glucose-6-phosphate isomerase [Elusimicrobiota bacterium]